MRLYHLHHVDVSAVLKGFDLQQTGYIRNEFPKKTKKNNHEKVSTCV